MSTWLMKKMLPTPKMPDVSGATVSIQKHIQAISVVVFGFVALLSIIAMSTGSWTACSVTLGNSTSNTTVSASFGLKLGSVNGGSSFSLLAGYGGNPDAFTTACSKAGSSIIATGLLALFGLITSITVAVLLLNRRLPRKSEHWQALCVGSSFFAVIMFFLGAILYPSIQGSPDAMYSNVGLGGSFTTWIFVCIFSPFAAIGSVCSVRVRLPDDPAGDSSY